MKTVALLIILGCLQALTYEDVIAAEFESFKVEYERSYEIEGEEQLRKQIFMDNKKLIDSHNKRYENGEETYTMAVNQFTDLLSSEFQKIMLINLNLTELAKGTYFPSNVEIPSQIDWRKRGAVTAVKNQGLCGSSWCFATTGTLEGHQFIKSKQLIPLSNQNLIDCYKKGNPQGGNPKAALIYVRDNHGLDTEKAYPYQGGKGICRFRPSGVGATVKRVVHVHPDESSLGVAVAKGPVAVGVDATKFQHYGGGVFSDRACHRQPNHFVLVVGYGHDYWLLKNSWGKSWGEHGYMKLARNRSNMCQVSSFAFYPVV